MLGLRLLGIGRNQYIDLMNQSRSGRKLFRKRNARELLPTKPIPKLSIEAWWIVHIGSITEDDMKVVFRKGLLRKQQLICLSFLRWPVKVIKA